MSVVRCDFCATRLDVTDATCPKCGALNSDYRESTSTNFRLSTVIKALILAVVVIALSGVVVLYRLPLTAINRYPALYEVSELVKRPTGMTKATVRQFFQCWLDGDINKMAPFVSKLGLAKGVLPQEASYLIHLYEFRVGKVQIEGQRASVSVHYTAGSVRDAAKALATVANPEGVDLNEVIMSSLKGAGQEPAHAVVHLAKEDGRWKILEGVDCGADELLEPITRPDARRELNQSDRWGPNVVVDATSCKTATLKSLDMVQLTGAVENKLSEAVGPVEIAVTFYDAENIEVGRSLVRLASLPPMSLTPFNCYINQVPSIPIRRFSYVVRSLY